MFNVRKSLVIAITVIMMLAMVVPAAMAAPEVLHGVSIVSPTTDHPAYINGSSSQSVKKLYIEFDVTIGGMQVDDVWVWARFVDKSHQDWASVGGVLDNTLLDDGVVQYRAPKPVGNDPDDDTPLSFGFANLTYMDEGWYDLVVCAEEADAWPETWTWCVTQQNALLVDYTDPAAWLDKPLGGVWARNPAQGIWLTGEEYLVGGGKDGWGLDDASAVFEYCAISTYELVSGWCGTDDAGWIPVRPGNVQVSPVNNEYKGTEYTGTWDTTLAPDDEGVIRFCVSDQAGNMSCQTTQVWLDNEFSINLRPGWNLISTPTALYDNKIESVLHHLLVANKVEVVYAYDKCSGCGGWKMFDPGAGPDSLTTIDPGKGYWIKMRGEAVGQLPLTFWGTWKAVGNNLPQSISVFKGWNLLGYVQWGRPTAPFFAPSLAADYLANIMTPIPGVGQGVQALVKYNAVTGLYEAARYWDPMELGKGYWMATDTDGTIVPAQW